MDGYTSVYNSYIMELNKGYQPIVYTLKMSGGKETRKPSRKNMKSVKKFNALEKALNADKQKIILYKNENIKDNIKETEKKNLSLFSKILERFQSSESLGFISARNLLYKLLRSSFEKMLLIYTEVEREILLIDTTLSEQTYVKNYYEKGKEAIKMIFGWFRKAGYDLYNTITQSPLLIFLVLVMAGAVIKYSCFFALSIEKAIEYVKKAFNKTVETVFTNIISPIFNSLDNLNNIWKDNVVYKSLMSIFGSIYNVIKELIKSLIDIFMSTFSIIIDRVDRTSTLIKESINEYIHTCHVQQNETKNIEVESASVNNESFGDFIKSYIYV
jgi:hypothetical protein